MSSITAQDELIQSNDLNSSTHSVTGNDDIILRMRSPVSSEIEMDRGVNAVKSKGDEERKKRQRESSKRYRENMKIKNESMRKVNEQFESAVPTLQRQISDLKEEVRLVKEQLASVQLQMTQSLLSNATVVSNGTTSIGSPGSNFGSSRSQSPQTNQMGQMNQSNQPGSLSDSPLMTNLPNQGSPMGPNVTPAPQLPGQLLPGLSGTDQTIFNQTPFGAKPPATFFNSTNQSTGNFPFIHTAQAQQPILLNQGFPAQTQLHPNLFSAISPLGFGGIGFPRAQNNAASNSTATVGTNAGSYGTASLNAIASVINNFNGLNGINNTPSSGIPSIGINLQAKPFSDSDFLSGKVFSNNLDNDLFKASYDQLKSMDKQGSTGRTGSSNSFLFLFIIALPFLMFPFFSTGQVPPGSSRATATVPMLTKQDLKIINDVANKRFAHIMDARSSSGVEDLSSSDSENEFVYGATTRGTSGLLKDDSRISRNIKFDRSMGVRVNSLQEYDSMMAKRNSLVTTSASAPSLNIRDSEPKGQDKFVDKYALTTNIVPASSSSMYEQNFMPYIQYITETFFQMALARGIKDPSTSLKDNFFRNLVNDLYDVMIDVTKKFCDSLLEACYNYEYSPANITQISNTTDV